MSGHHEKPGGLFRYHLLLRLFAPLILCFNTWQAIKARDARLFCQRLGLCLPKRKDKPLWFHTASVGEVIAVQPLIEVLRKTFPQIPVIVTTTTPTGAKIAAQRLPHEVQHFYLPVDWPGAVKRFLRATQPRAALIMETELWPNLFVTAARQNIPLIIINARLSRRTLEAGNWVKQLYALCLKSVTAVLARSEKDANAYIQLGAPAAKVQTLGNIKFASATGSQTINAIDLGRPFVLAASTHHDEEKQLVELWKQLELPNKPLLVIAPRHPQRLNDIVQQLSKLNVNMSVRSRGDNITDDTTIYLADTLGELEGFMAGAQWVFMGGSLVPQGGHNILEPARLGKPIVFGPHMENFSDETALLLDHNAARQIANQAELVSVINEWLLSPKTAKTAGNNARDLMAAQGNVLDRYLGAIAKACGLKL